MKRHVIAIGLLATITVLESNNEEFQQTFLDLTEKVKANEPGNVFYALHKSGSDPQVYKVMEQLDSPQALDAHGKSDYFREANKQLNGLVAGAAEIEILEVVTRLGQIGDGAECRSRTCDLRFRRPTLYPAELIPRKANEALPRRGA